MVLVCTSLDYSTIVEQLDSLLQPQKKALGLGESLAVPGLNMTVWRNELSAKL